MTKSCPRCQLAGPHADAAACIGALLAWCRLLQAEVEDLRRRLPPTGVWVYTPPKAQP